MRPFPLSTAVLLLSFVACTQAGDEEPRARGPVRSPTPSAPAVGPLIAFLGDSLSAGLHCDADEAFPAVLQRTLAAEGVPFRLVNAGVSGDTTAGGLQRVDWLLRREPDWVVIELGGNDGLRGTPLEATRENLVAIVRRVKAANARPIVFGMRLPPNYGADYADGFADVFARVAEEEDVPFVPFFLEGVGGVVELNHPDGIHPTAEGHRRIARGLAPFFRDLLGAL